ncbi:MAG: hypothetical protein LRY45_08090, partial [Bacteroides graminisolvens]|nr:hypothetical protein [Bacteroides graminisolvens]
MIRKKQLIRYIVLGILLGLVLMVQSIPAWGEVYARSVYPVIGALLSSLSHEFLFRRRFVHFSQHNGSSLAFPFTADTESFHGKKCC